MSSASVSVPARGKAAHTVEVSSAGLITWAVELLSKDIVLSATWTPREGGSSIIAFPAQKVESAQGNWPAGGPGKLVFEFDNTFSLMTGKDIRLRFAKVALPEGGVPPSAGFDPTQAHALNRLCMRGLTFFFENEFQKAEDVFAQEAHRVPIFSLSFATLAWLRALMTWEADAIAEAQKRLKATQNLCSAFMGKDVVASLTSPRAEAAALASAAAGGGAAPEAPSTPHLASGGMSLVQLEATLIHAEATLLTGLLHLMEESVMGLVRTALAIRAGHGSYKVCDKQLGEAVTGVRGGEPLSTGFVISRLSSDPADIPATEAEAVRDARCNIEEGLAFGLGAFNTVASMLPPILLRVIAALGFPSDRQAGLEQLRRSLRGGRIRAPLSALVILAMRVLLPSFSCGDVAEHAGEATAVVDAMLAAFPESALPLWMAGRLARMQGDPERAAALFDRCAAAAGTGIVQLSHLCAYEQAWARAFCADWEGVLPLTTRLVRENNWSKGFYAYMQAVSLLQLGRVAEARRAMVSVLRHSSRRLGGRVIPAEQYAVRRAAEFVALTTVEGGGVGGDPADAEAEAAAEAEVLRSMPPSPPLPRLRLPAVVERGSPAHACVLAYPLPLPGLEAIYLFSGMPQMTRPALAAALHQVDAVLAQVGAGNVFNAAAPVWSGRAATMGAGGSAWDDTAAGAGRAEPPARTPAETRALLEAAATARVSSAEPAPAAASGGGSRFGGFGGFGLLKSAVSSVSGAISGLAATAAGAVGASVGGSGTSAFALASPLLPVHVAAVGGIVRGAICAALGRVDEASTCLSWVSETGAGGSLRREAHVVGYAHYEEGTLAQEVMRARVAAAAGGHVDTTGGSTRERSMHPGPGGEGGVLASALAASLPTAAAAEHRAAVCLKRAREGKEDFNWRVRLLMRVHLALDDVRARAGRSTRRKAKGEFAGAAAGGGGPEEGAGAGDFSEGEGGGSDTSSDEEEEGSAGAPLSAEEEAIRAELAASAAAKAEAAAADAS